MLDSKELLEKVGLTSEEACAAAYVAKAFTFLSYVYFDNIVWEEVSNLKMVALLRIDYKIWYLGR